MQVLRALVGMTTGTRKVKIEDKPHISTACCGGDTPGRRIESTLSDSCGARDGDGVGTKSLEYAASLQIVRLNTVDDKDHS